MSGPRFRFCPSEIIEGAPVRYAVASGLALPLAGGPMAFCAVEAFARGGEHRFLKIAEANDQPADLQRIAAPRPDWAGFRLDRPLIMGILNVTPDSFSDGGAFLDPSRAIAHGRAMKAAGADIIDVGGESTRPGAAPVDPEEEIRRVVPVIAALAGEGAVVSIDSRRGMVTRAALAAGAKIINDVSALAFDPESMAVARESGAALVLMHMTGTPATMQDNPVYDDVALDVLEHLEARLAACEAAGIPRGRILVDPGIGFGKRSIEHNLPLLRRVALLHATGCGILVGLSRKAFLGRVSRDEPASDRLAGSLAGALWCVSQGVQAVRVHDVAETRQALAVRRAIVSGVS